MTTAIEAIDRLIEHATEAYPHFESVRGERDLADAREALRRLCGVTLAAIMVEARWARTARAGDLADALTDLREAVRDLDDIGTQPVAGVSEYDR